MHTNPILTGFNPDPSICKVGDDFYIATSTFEWYPGVQIHHSRDLSQWRTLPQALSEARLLDLRGVPDSCGVWAPCLSWDGDRFYLIYTVVRRFDGNFKDTHNYLVSSDSIEGPWSDPVYLNSSGFDPSLFHGASGKKWVVNMLWDHRQNKNRFGGILLQEYCSSSKKLIGPVRNIFKGTALGCTEAPHLYQRKGFYYLMTAEGGTGYGHAVTMARSTSLFGPYEVDPGNPILSARAEPDYPIQRAGHGDMVELDNGQVAFVYLCSRPIANKKFSPLCRETALQFMLWNDEGWLRSTNNFALPELQIDLPRQESCSSQVQEINYPFNSEQLPVDFQWLRSPDHQRLFSLQARPGYLRLYGREAIGSQFEQALVARRQQHFTVQASTFMQFMPENIQQMAGIACYYNAHKFFYLFVSWDEEIGTYLSVMSCEGQLDLTLSFPLDQPISVDMNEGISLGLDINKDRLRYRYKLPSTDWQYLSIESDFTCMCDEAGKGEGAQFSGNFIGLCCQDISGQAKVADFSYLHYLGQAN